MTVRALALLLLLVAVPGARADGGDSARFCGVEAGACVEYGAQVFERRCALCHGTDGMGEGVLPLTLGDYPDTNLVTSRLAPDRDAVHHVVSLGASLPEVRPEMPPWGDELTHTQLRSVVSFVMLLREDTEGALTLVRRILADEPPSLRVGRAIYVGRCALCHGPEGRGDGRMAAIIKAPPPFDLTYSRLPDDYLFRMISEGGAAMNRSPRMPPWGSDLTETELYSVMAYVKTLRR